MRQRAALGEAEAGAVLDAACAQARTARLEVSVAVVDEAGVRLALHRLDGARLHTPEAATLKARTAAITRTETAALETQVRSNPALLAFPGRLPLAGGVPLLWQGEVVGGIGSSGGTPQEDLAVCAAGLAALG